MRRIRVEGLARKFHAALSPLAFLVTAVAMFAATAASAQAAPGGSPPSAIASQPIPDQIENIVQSPALSSMFAGDTVSGGQVTVYVTAQGAATISSALAAIPAADYKLVTVSHSSADLNTLTQRIAGDASSLSASGVQMMQFGPDPQTNTVRIQLANYTPTAAQTLEQRYGAAAVTVVQASGMQPGLRLANRYSDTTPYFNGDRIWINNGSTGCTSNFAYRGNASGNIFDFTAGHCGGSSIWTNDNNRQEMGTVSSVYFTNNGWDVESFHCGNCAGDYVWSGTPSSSSSKSVVGSCGCGQGSSVAVDGATSGEFDNNYVGSTNQCVYFGGNVPYTCNLNDAESFNGQTQICTGGDSGGPVMQNIGGTGQVDAVGEIVGITNYGLDCWYHPIGSVMSLLNGSLLVL